jgi:tetratricopeptide (TPR) repeat protein
MASVLKGVSTLGIGVDVLYVHKGDNDRAIADFNEAIRLDPNNALAFCNRGRAKLNIKDASGNADIAKAAAC